MSDNDTPIETPGKSSLKESRLLSRYKIKKIKKSLENRMIIMLKNKRGIVVVFNGREEEVMTQQFIARTSRGTFDKTIVIFGVSSSSHSLIDMGYALRTIKGRISKSLNTRDVQSIFFRNFLCYYLKQQIYDSDNQEAIGMSFLVLQIESVPRESLADEKGNWFLAHLSVDHLGEYRFLDSNENSHILACTNETKRQDTTAFLAAADIEHLELAELGNTAESALKHTFGETITTQAMLWPF